MSTDGPQPGTRFQRFKSLIDVGLARWREFWFAPEDPFTLGIVRVLTGSMLAYNLLVWGLDLQAFFSSDGLQPLAAVRKFYGNDLIFSFLFYVPDAWLAAVHWCCFGIAVLMCAGVCSRLTTICCFLITISYSHRVPVANFGLDQILGLLCLYLAIGPSGASLSVDSIWRRRSQRAAGVQAQPVKLASCRMTLRLIQIHLCIIYFWAGFAKLKGDSWWTGEAMWQVLANQEYQTMDLTWMAWVPWVPYLIAHVTVAWEVFFCVLIWNKALRPIMLMIGASMHFGIGAFLGMWTFGLVMTYAYFSFSCPEFWRKRLRRFAPRRIDHSDSGEQLQAPQDDSKITAVAQRQRVLSHDEVNAHLQPGSVDKESDSPSEVEATPAVSSQRTIATIPPVSESMELGAGKPAGALLDRSVAFDADRELANSMLVPDTSVLLIAAHAEERRTLRRYFRGHDIPCKAATNAETAFQILSALKPVAIVLSGSRFRVREFETLLEDLVDATDTPILAVVSMAQKRVITVDKEHPMRTLLYPSSPREIRSSLSQLLFGEADSEADTSSELPSQHEPGVYRN